MNVKIIPRDKLYAFQFELFDSHFQIGNFTEDHLWFIVDFLENDYKSGRLKVDIGDSAVSIHIDEDDVAFYIRKGQDANGMSVPRSKVFDKELLETIYNLQN